MGVRTASARHLRVLVMAPALTETDQSEKKFNLSPKTTHKGNNFPDYQFKSLMKHATNTTTSTTTQKNDAELSGLGNELVMNDNSRMDDNQPLDRINNMGFENATGTIDNNISSLVKDAKCVSNDVDHILNNFVPDLEGMQPPNVDEIMQAIKSMESTNATDSMIFSLPSDLTSNLSSFEKEFLNDVDVMNISIDDALIDTPTTSKENTTKDLATDLHKKQAKLERRVDFLLRRLRKTQAKSMGQHVSNEVAGVFEHANRTLRKAKESIVGNNQQQNVAVCDPSLSSSPSTSATTCAEKLKPISQSSAKSLVRKLETSTIYQANSFGRSSSSKYGGASRFPIDPNFCRGGNVGGGGGVGGGTGYQYMTVLPQWSNEHKAELEKVSATLQTQLRVVQKTIDSDATASSSGGESCDELQTYGNPHQQYLSIEKRAAWRYASNRAAIGARWTWLQAQIADLEYRIRQYNDLQKIVRASKGPITFEGDRDVPTTMMSIPLNGYRGQLPGAANKTATNETTTADESCERCARVRPLRAGFRKRKLVQVSGLHAVSKKAARPSTVRCGCAPNNGFPLCAVCTGRTDPTLPKEPFDCLNRNERIAMIDPSYHPVISFPDEVSSSIHLESIMKSYEWQTRSTKSNIKNFKLTGNKSDRPKNITNDDDPTAGGKKIDHRRKYNKLVKTKIKKIRGRKPMLQTSLERLKNKRHTTQLAMARLNSMSAEGADDETEMLSNSTGGVDHRLMIDSPCSSPLLAMQAISGYNSKQRNSRVSSYDIDNIVIPYSVAASTRVEKLQYKEILTPKWRLVDPDFAMRYTKTNGVVRDTSQDSDIEDLSDEALVTRHEKCEHDERKKFLSYLKFPLGYGRARSHKRTDSRAESSGANTPDRMSPTTCSPVLSPPVTPLPAAGEDAPPQPYPLAPPLPSVSVIRKRTISHQSNRSSSNRDAQQDDEDTGGGGVFEAVMMPMIPPYDKRTFPLNEDQFDRMLKQMPDDYKRSATNARSEDVKCFSLRPTTNVADDRDDGDEGMDEDVDGNRRRQRQEERLELRKKIEGELEESDMVTTAAGDDSDSTESAIGEEDPNDPEWSNFDR